MVKRPRIAITMRLEMETGRFYLGRDYCESIEAAGGTPIHIGLIPKREYIADVLSDVDGVLLPGSNTDVDPQYYGEEPHHRLGTVIPEKDETDRLVIAEAERLNLPILGICYGMQAINVMRGGTLIQDIESQVTDSVKHEQGMPARRNSHSLDVEADSWLGRLGAAGETIRVNSSHHQAIGNLGTGLKATAKAKDGIVECIEDVSEGKFIVGVQWHPELTTGHDEVSKEIFMRFVERCSERAADNKMPAAA